MAFAAVKADGSVVIWGDAEYGGNFSAVAALLTEGVVQICGAFMAFAAVKADGTVAPFLTEGVVQVCGAAKAFAAGDARYGGNSSAVAPLLTEGVVHISGTDEAFAAIKADGSVVTWGDARYGGNSSAVAPLLTEGVHSSESELQGLIGMVKEKCEELSRHQFGNFVVQHLFEHQASCRPDLLKPLLCKMSELAMHRTASHVVQSALYHCEEEGQKDIVESLLRATYPSPAIEQVAMGRYGSYVAEQLATLPSSWVQSVDLKQRLKSSLVELCAAENGFGRRVAEKFGLVDCVPLQQPKAQAPDI
ncbi:unnamed protein product [Polarella glacialis]|uniref:PUM-HD domain-containing protein n=1 Tax=Polarella glacialis TaxID=89957 RepID=A0A813LPU2_POLGL|nr:unnamed protein product [Polarella glacialis]